MKIRFVHPKKKDIKPGNIVFIRTYDHINEGFLFTPYLILEEKYSQGLDCISLKTRENDRYISANNLESWWVPTYGGDE